MLLLIEKKVKNMIKIDIISGFLGAGKTTLIQKLFKEAFEKEKIVLIENEFGEIGIDGGFLKESGVNIKEINSGCICCSLVGDFSKSLKEVINTYNPDRIIIEPSGVGKLSDIKKAVLKLDADVELNILATVVDGSKTKVYMRNFGEFFNDQVGEANTIIVSRVDKIDENKLDETVKLLKEKNKFATIITTDIKLLDGKKLLDTLESEGSLTEQFIEEVEHEHHEHHHHDEEECCCGHHHEHHHHDEEECCCGHHHEHHHHDEEECCCGHHHEHHHHDEEECCCGHHHEHHHHGHHHDAEEVFTSWGKETHKSYSYEELVDILEELSQNESLGVILRSKGIVKANDNEKWYYFDFVSGEYEIRLGSPDVVGKLCVIGSNIDEESISKLFK